MYKKENGSVVVSVFIIMIFLTLTVLTLSVINQSNISRSYSRLYMLQAQYAAESGADAAIAYINRADPATGGTLGSYPDSGVKKLLVQNTDANSQSYKAMYTATTSAVTDESGASDPNKLKVTSVGEVYRPATASNPTHRYKIEVLVERSIINASSSIVSRNSVVVDSSVKNITAKSLYINSFMNVESNSTDVTIDQLSIAGKVPQNGAACSLLGKGHLKKRVDLGGPVELTMAGVNCMDPIVGNTSSPDFTISSNDTTIRPISSTHIPWNFKMNDAYTSSGSCSDWISGSSTATIHIPATLNSKKTHYPDTLSGVATGVAPSCGNGGDLNLGERTIVLDDHAHVRGHFCKNSDQCRPKFINPDSAHPKFVFVEGVINFKNVTVKEPESPGDVVLISYSPAISGVAGVNGSKCNGNVVSIHFNNDGSNNVVAPNLYVISTVGTVCIDQTKFPSTSDALGGISGHDLVVSSNSGTVFTLAFNPEFPVSEIPVDLSWRATHTKRLY